jgi:tetratricopeptide (TPR) repeat protein
MSGDKTPTKEQVLETIEDVRNNPHDRVDILANIGIGAVGAAGAGYAASMLGASSLFFGLIPVAAPLAVVAGGAILGGAALIGVKRFLFDGTSLEGKREALLVELEKQIREIEAKEQAASLGEDDKYDFHIFLAEPVRLDLISPQDAQKLMLAVEGGQLSLKEAYQLVEDLLNSENIEDEDVTDISSQQLERTNAEDYHQHGMEKAKRGKYKEAIEDFTQAVCINPNYATAYKYRGLAYSRLGETQAASADFHKAADLYLKQGHPEDYQDVLDRAFKLQTPAPKPEAQTPRTEEEFSPEDIDKALDALLKGINEAK